MRDEPQLEIHLPDEDREFETHLFHFRCRCLFTPNIERKDGRFRVKCGRLKDLYFSALHHTDPTPWLPSSYQAIQHWKMVAVLSRS